MGDVTPVEGSERQILTGLLRDNREVVVWKCRGVPDEVARRAPFASDTSLIGLVQHLAVVETSWFQDVFAGKDVTYPFDFDADIDAEWHLQGDETVEEAVASYRRAAAESDAVIAEADLTDLAAREHRRATGPVRPSLRWIIAHMIEETARHAGHADILREHLDGTVGYLPPA